jgi:hypothetical protein
MGYVLILQGESGEFFPERRALSLEYPRRNPCATRPNFFCEKHMTEQKPPQISPYLFPIGLFCFGLWFFYDGWISTNPDMQEHLMFNRVGSAILLPWAVIDFIRTRKAEREYKKRIKDSGPAS